MALTQYDCCLSNNRKFGHTTGTGGRSCENTGNQNQIFIMKFSGPEPKHCTLLPFLSKVLLRIGSWKEGAENSGAVSWL